MKFQMFVSPRIVRLSAHAAILMLLLFASGREDCAWPQYPTVGYTGALPIPSSVDEMSNEFLLGKLEQREDLLRRLGVDSRFAHDAATVVTDTAIKVEKLEGTEANLLFLPCAGQGVPTAHLLLMRPAPQQAWRVVDDAPLDCWYQNATYELLSIPGQSSQAILAHHVNAGHGSGLVQDDMLLLGVRGEHLAPLLRVQEYMSEDIAGTDKTVEQKSTLQPFPDGSLEETRATTFHESLSVAPRAEGDRTGTSCYHQTPTLALEPRLAEFHCGRVHYG
jgi:hypothetical protein